MTGCSRSCKHGNKYWSKILLTCKTKWRITYRKHSNSFVISEKTVTVTEQQLSATTRHASSQPVYSAPAVGNDKSISYSWTDICFVWEEKPLEPISSTHSIHCESLCALAVWINPVSSLPTEVGNRGENHHLFLLFIPITQVRWLRKREMNNPFTFSNNFSVQ